MTNRRASGRGLLARNTVSHCFWTAGQGFSCRVTLNYQQIVHSHFWDIIPHFLPFLLCPQNVLAPNVASLSLRLCRQLVINKERSKEKQTLLNLMGRGAQACLLHQEGAASRTPRDHTELSVQGDEHHSPLPCRKQPTLRYWIVVGSRRGKHMCNRNQNGTGGGAWPWKSVSLI